LIANLTAWWQQETKGNTSKGFIFAEIGYASYQGAATNAPGCCSGSVDLQTQATLYQSFFEAVWEQPWMAGVFWWAWPANGAGGTPCSTGFDVYAKPAANVLSKYYGQGKSSVPMDRYGPGLVVGSVAPLTIYAAGITTWDDWSWGAQVNLQDPKVAYPGHAFSISATVPSNDGALVLHAPNGAQGLEGYSFLALDVIVPNATQASQLTAFFCTCTSCDTGCSLPSVQLVVYTSDGQQCTLATDWSSTPSKAHVAIPLDVLAPGRNASTTIARVQVGADAPSGPVTFKIDNVQLV
jgi:hypothetical protein